MVGVSYIQQKQEHGRAATSLLTAYSLQANPLEGRV